MKREKRDISKTEGKLEDLKNKLNAHSITVEDVKEIEKEINELISEFIDEGVLEEPINDQNIDMLKYEHVSGKMLIGELSISDSLNEKSKEKIIGFQDKIISKDTLHNIDQFVNEIVSEAEEARNKVGILKEEKEHLAIKMSAMKSYEQLLDELIR